MAKINIKDLVIDTYSHAIPQSECEMWITHKPTGLKVYGNGIGRAQLKERLINELQNLLDAKYKAKEM